MRDLSNSGKYCAEERYSHCMTSTRALTQQAGSEGYRLASMRLPVQAADQAFAYSCFHSHCCRPPYMHARTFSVDEAHAFPVVIAVLTL